jgi:hypothetical protein
MFLTSPLIEQAIALKIPCRGILSEMEIYRQFRRLRDEGRNETVLSVVCILDTAVLRFRVSERRRRRTLNRIVAAGRQWTQPQLSQVTSPC